MQEPHTVLFLDCEKSKEIMAFIDTHSGKLSSQAITDLLLTELSVKTNRIVVQHYINGKPKKCPVCKTPFFAAKSRATCGDTCRDEHRLRRQYEAGLNAKREDGTRPAPVFVGRCKSINIPPQNDPGSRWLCGQAL